LERAAALAREELGLDSAPMLRIACLLAAPIALSPQPSATDDFFVESGSKAALYAGHQPDNVLVFVLDDVGVDMIGAYAEGQDLPPTPVMDGLAAEGVLFRHAWAAPVCSPARAMLQTGLYGFHNGVGMLSIEAVPNSFLPLEHVTLPEMLASAGYRTALFGKWHLGVHDEAGFVEAPTVAGYEHYEGPVLGLFEEWFTIVEFEGGEVDIVENYAPTEKVDDFLEWVAEEDGPWFATVSFNLAHSPYHAPPAHLHSVDLSGGDDRSLYKAMVQAIDTEVGRAIDGLGAARKHTTVFVVSDNGTPGEVLAPGVPPDQGKGSLFEGGINVPMIVSGSAVEQPGESTALVNLADVYATAAEIGGVDLESVLPSGVSLDSVSLVPYLQNPKTKSKRRVNWAEFFSPAGLGNGDLVTGPADLCQDDLGFSSSPSLELQVCGGILSPPNHGDLLLRGAAPGSVATIYTWGGGVPAPFEVPGGTLVGDPGLAIAVESATLDDHGMFVGLDFVNSASLESEGRIQAVLQDPQGGVEVSNALRLAYVPISMKAVRNQTHKLIFLPNLANVELVPAWEFLYQLEDELGRPVDPYEQHNLLEAPLSPADQLEYLDLKTALFEILTD